MPSFLNTIAKIIKQLDENETNLATCELFLNEVELNPAQENLKEWLEYVNLCHQKVESMKKEVESLECPEGSNNLVMAENLILGCKSCAFKLATVARKLESLEIFASQEVSNKSKSNNTDSKPKEVQLPKSTDLQELANVKTNTLASKGDNSYDMNNNDPSLSPEDYTAKFVKFINETPTAYHAVKCFAKTLEELGSFTYLPERGAWEDLILTNNKFYTTRNGTSLIAFVIGKDWEPGQGAGIVAAHTDSITARVKPVSKKPATEGYRMMGTAPYSGGFSNVWWDRDLGVAGRVVVKNAQNKSIESKLVHIPYPIARIPTLAPHFGAPANGPFNKETQMTPIIGLCDAEEDLAPTESEKQSPLYGKHDLKLLRLIAHSIKTPLEDMLTFDLELFDTQPATLGGLDAEFLICPRLDDKLCSYAGLFGLLESLKASENSSVLNIVALFDNEEIGSETRQGAMGGLLQTTINRLLALHGDSNDELKQQTYANSYLVSSDVNHAVNPNFTEVYLKDHSARLNTGVAIGLDSQGDLATDAVSLALLEEIARRTNNPLQYTQTRNGEKEGSTIGPMLSSATGIRAIDIGIPQLSMHSLRATTGSKDVWLGVRLYKAIFEQWFKVDAAFKNGDL
ncbi:hypothetical protein NADFUDRAFT_44938 [Nadsonia fulvescens var. elongata DSM 6958]|uniref:Peptidase M18, aminopeptidase I n=1 Tax=Nadsonia fulvescens var. elongata DSM 6958 TaxID=857566 RepID=A0A1E3PSW1_9ASCO|nr:hypothetical protein NADFUDRAFT_44938 [Nadsonia fulvescens var. elongata DSM 6958]